MIMLRATREIAPGKMGEYMAIESRVAARYPELGLPVIKTYRPFIGGDSSNTVLIDTEWESLSALDAAGEKLHADPVIQEARRERRGLVVSNRLEILRPL